LTRIILNTLVPTLVFEYSYSCNPIPETPDFNRSQQHVACTGRGSPPTIVAMVYYV